MEFCTFYGMALPSGTVALFCRANGAFATIFAIVPVIISALYLMIRIRTTGVVDSEVRLCTYQSAFTRKKSGTVAFRIAFTVIRRRNISGSCHTVDVDFDMRSGKTSHPSIRTYIATLDVTHL